VLTDNSQNHSVTRMTHSISQGKLDSRGGGGSGVDYSSLIMTDWPLQNFTIL